MAGMLPAPTPSHETAQVIVIDDNEVVRRSIARLLQTAGMRVIAAPSAIGATRTMLRSHARVAVVDLDMPEMRGTALVEILRKNPKLSDVGVVIVSGVSAEELLEAASSSGADACVSKEDMHKTLVPIVTRLLRRRTTRSDLSGR
jgi:CheY-like chemotaxis protein